MTKPLRHTTILFAAVLAAAATLAAVPAAQAAPASLEQATSTCWLDVINDWLDNNQVDRSYAIPCYTQAIQHLNLYPDVKGYSSAIDDIQRAQLAAIHQERNDGGPTSGGGSSGGGTSGGGTSGGGTSGGGTSGGGASASGSGNGGIFGVHDATSVPLPLIVLGALAILLALAALGTWLARRIQTRRPTPAPAIAKRR
jgi:hypothetical protein